MWANHIQSSAPTQSQKCLYTSPRGKGWAPSHSLLRHGWGHRVDEMLHPSRVPTRVAHSEATSIKRPWETSLMRHSHSTCRWSCSRGRQQQQHQSPPQRNPMQGGAHSQTPTRSPPGMFYLQQSCHTLSMEMNGYITLPAALNHSHTRNPQGKQFTWPSQELLQCTPWGAHIHENQLLRAQPRAQHRSWCGLTSQAWMIWVMHHICLLTWSASSNGLKMPPISKVMLEVCQPLQPCTLLNDLRWQCWRGRATKGALQMPGEQDPSQASSHLLGPQLQVEPNPKPHHARPDLMAKGLGQGIHHEDEGHTQLVATVHLFVPGVHKWSPHLLCITFGQETGCRFLVPHSHSQKIGMWDPPPSLSSLCHNDFLPPGDLQGSWDIHDMRKEKTLTLAQALKICSKWSGGSFSIICSAARDLQGCMANLMQFGRRTF